MKPNDATAAAAAGAAWKVSRRGASCAVCARPFEEGNYVFSALVVEEPLEAGAAPIRRIDRCDVCHRKRERAPLEILWRTEFHAEAKKAKIDLAALIEVFRQLAASADPRFTDLRYLVTLLLLRHRKIRVVRTRSGETQDYLLVSFGRTKQVYEVAVSDLSAERLEGLRGQLVTIFAGGDVLAAEARAIEPTAVEPPPAGESAAGGDSPGAVSESKKGA
jgi:hypothetical protein